MFDFLFKRPEEPEALRDHVERMERRVKALEIEWEQTYDKIHTALRRIAKRAERMANAETPEEPEPAESGSTAPRLTPRQVEAERQIKLRRERGANSGLLHG